MKHLVHTYEYFPCDRILGLQVMIMLKVTFLISISYLRFFSPTVTLVKCLLWLHPGIDSSFWWATWAGEARQLRLGRASSYTYNWLPLGWFALLLTNWPCCEPAKAVGRWAGPQVCVAPGWEVSTLSGHMSLSCSIKKTQLQGKRSPELENRREDTQRRLAKGMGTRSSRAPQAPPNPPPRCQGCCKMRAGPLELLTGQLNPWVLTL